MYKLYDGQGTGGVTIRAALAEIGAPFEVVEIDLAAGAQRSEEFTRLNSCQQVPVLELPDGTVLTENIAILMRPSPTRIPRPASRRRVVLSNAPRSTVGSRSSS